MIERPLRSSPDGEPARTDQIRSRVSLLPLLLLLLAVLDLRTDLRLLIDHVTFTTLFAAIGRHPLAVVVLAAQPSLWRRYGSRR